MNLSPLNNVQPADFQKTAFRRATAVIAAFSLSILAACGGGSSSSASPSASPAAPASPASAATVVLPPAVIAPPTISEPQTTADVSISLLASPGSSAATFTSSGDIVSDSIAFINVQRAQAGLPTLSSNAGIAHAAANHALYNTVNNIGGHYETAGNTDFTGVDPATRVNLYYTSASVGEIASTRSNAWSSSYEAIDGLFDAPFHRNGIFQDVVNAGTGTATPADSAHPYNVVVDFADYSAFLPDSKLIAWPYSGQVGVKTKWLAVESPNPMSGSPSYEGQVVGYPITLMASGSNAFSNITFTIKDPLGNLVACQETDASNNVEASRLAMCVPFSPLLTATTYTVSVSGTLTYNSTSPPTSKAFSVSWMFTTASADNVPPGTR